MLAIATKIVRNYGRLLADIEPGCCALPRSLLPHSRDAIHEATLRILGTLGGADAPLRDALIRGFVFLAQFVDDHEAQQVADDQMQLAAAASANSGDSASAPDLVTVSIVDKIKLDMQQSLIQACLVAKIPLSEAPSLLK